MPARDLYHNLVVELLIADGWTITHDPLRLYYDERRVYVDIGAERQTLAAEKGEEKIAVEVKTFLSPSPIDDLEEAIGQYIVYRQLLKRQQPGRKLFLALPERAYTELFAGLTGSQVRADIDMSLLIFDEETQQLSQWIP